jgi:hypothetical protein
MFSRPSVQHSYAGIGTDAAPWPELWTTAQGHSRQPSMWCRPLGPSALIHRDLWPCHAGRQADANHLLSTRPVLDVFTHTPT